MISFRTERIFTCDSCMAHAGHTKPCEFKVTCRGIPLPPENICPYGLKEDTFFKGPIWTELDYETEH